MMNKVCKTINLPEEILKEIEAILSNSPGLDFNTFIIQAINEKLGGKTSSTPLTMADLKVLTGRYIKDNSKGFGPQGMK